MREQTNSGLDQEKVLQDLQKAIDAEQAISSCFRYISGLIKNGRVRVKFVSFAEKSERNKEALLGRLVELGQANFKLEDKCTFCKLTPKSFSLFGALNLGLEMTGISRKIYGELMEADRDPQDKALFRQLLDETKQLKSFLKKEKKFTQHQSQPDFIMNFCIPHIAGRLSK